jgi:hypothetical protein
MSYDRQFADVAFAIIRVSVTTIEQTDTKQSRGRSQSPQWTWQLQKRNYMLPELMDGT